MFTQSLITSVVIFNRKFNPQQAQAGDYNIIARGATSLIAKEVRGMQVDQLAATLRPEELIHIDERKLIEARLKVRDLGDLLVSPDEAERRQAAQAQAQQAQQAVQEEARRKALSATALRTSGRALAARAAAEAAIQERARQEAAAMVKASQQAGPLLAKQRVLEQKKLTAAEIARQAAADAVEAAQRRAAEEMELADVIRRIRALEAVPGLTTGGAPCSGLIAPPDPSCIPAAGEVYLCSMSLVELRTRLALLQQAQQEELARKREGIVVLRQGEKAFVASVAERVGRRRAANAAACQAARQARRRARSAAAVAAATQSARSQLLAAEHIAAKHEATAAAAAALAEERRIASLEGQFFATTHAAAAERRQAQLAEGVARRQRQDEEAAAAAQQRAAMIARREEEVRAAARAQAAAAATSRRRASDAGYEAELQEAQEYAASDAVRRNSLVSAARAREQALEVLQWERHPFTAQVAKGQRDTARRLSLTRLSLKAASSRG